MPGFLEGSHCATLTSHVDMHTVLYPYMYTGDRQHHYSLMDKKDRRTTYGSTVLVLY